MSVDILFLRIFHVYEEKLTTDVKINDIDEIHVIKAGGRYKSVWGRYRGEVDTLGGAGKQ